MPNLKELLKSWKLENVLSHLVAENIDVEVLQIMKVSHLTSLLSPFPLGTQIRFEHNFEQWRHKIGKPLKITNCNDQHQRITKGYSCRNRVSNANKSHSDDLMSTTKGCETNSASSIDLKSILLLCQPVGQELLDIYCKNQTFSKPERNYLINLIVNYYLNHGFKFNLHISYELENAILALFPKESLFMYRTGQQGVIYTKYLQAEADYKKDGIENEANVSKNLIGKSVKNEHDQDLLITTDYCSKEASPTITDMPAELLLQTICNGLKRFVKIYEPYLYQDFFLAACCIFNISNRKNFYLAINDCEILKDDFKDVILQYYKITTFTIELKERVQLITPEDFSNTYSPAKTFDTNATGTNSSVQIIYNYLPDAKDIRNIPSLLPIVRMSDDGKMLANKHRAAIAKAIIEECLNFQPHRVLKRQDFFTLTHNLICAFPTEVESTYFIPSQPNEHARGKLWNAYNNKRRMLASSGVLERRHPAGSKRKHQSDGESDKTNDKVYVTDLSLESVEFSLNSTLEWQNLKQKWCETFTERREKLLKGQLTPSDYINKYSILKSERGIELMELDVNFLHPTVVDVNNWLSLYNRIVSRGRLLQEVKIITKILYSIDSSNDEKYRASLALLIIPYIFPHIDAQNDLYEKTSEYDIQKSFIKEYEALEDLQSDNERADLQIRFVHCDHHINYAEFKICDHIFKFTDLLDAFNSIFHYTIALNMEYPILCRHIWQFVQLAIFQIEIQDADMQANVESIFNDLCMS